LPAVRRALTNDWDVRDPARCVTLLEAARAAYPPSVVEDLVDMFVQPKLAAAVKQWNPATDALPIHSWLHQWLPLMRSKLSALYPDIRRKLHHALAQWEARDNAALATLRPWKGVFDAASMEGLVVKAIVPKLVVALRDVPIHPCAPTKDDDAAALAAFHRVLEWKDLVPRAHFISLFSGEFFPRWLRVLVTWLGLAPDFADVSEWYVGWKERFPDDVVQDPDIVKPLNVALDLMNVVLTAEDDACADLLKRAAAAIPDDTYFTAVGRRLAESKMRTRLDELQGSKGPLPSSASASVADFTFKDVVASFAMTKGVAFAPKHGKQHEGKQLYEFGKCTCYLDHDVVFVHESGGGERHAWKPVALDDLLVRCQ
jgi:tuftelin-interacting protein 11